MHSNIYMNVKDYLETKITSTRELAGNVIYDEDRKPYPQRRFLLAISKHVKQFRDSFPTAKRNTRILRFPGIRGVGKTVALLQLWDGLVNSEKNKVPQENVLYFSMDEVREASDSSLYELISTFIEKIHEQKRADIRKELFILIDEAHFDENWDTALKVIYDSSPRNLFIMAAGSSAMPIQMSPDLARRSYRETAFPLNFSEYMTMKHGFYPQKGTASAVRAAVLDPSEKNVRALNSIESGNRIKLLGKGINLKGRLREFVFHGGFASGISASRFDVCEKTTEIVHKTIAKDLPRIRNFTLGSQTDIMRVVNFLADKIGGGFSREKISQQLGIPSKKVDQILNSLEQSQLIFPVKPYGSGNQRKPWKYYFMSPTIAVALYSRIRPADIWDDDRYGKLTESLFASYLFRICYERGSFPGPFYDPKESSADFIIENEALPVPVEVGVGSKSSRQVKNSMRNCKNSKYGILIHDCEKTEMKEKVLHVPTSTFAFL